MEIKPFIALHFINVIPTHNESLPAAVCVNVCPRLQFGGGGGPYKGRAELINSGLHVFTGFSEDWKVKRSIGLINSHEMRYLESDSSPLLSKELPCVLSGWGEDQNHTEFISKIVFPPTHRNYLIPISSVISCGFSLTWYFFSMCAAYVLNNINMFCSDLSLVCRPSNEDTIPRNFPKEKTQGNLLLKVIWWTCVVLECCKWLN